MNRKYDTLIDRLMANCKIERLEYSSSCWLWLGSLNNKGYGRITVREKGKRSPSRRLAHIVCYEEHIGRRLDPEEETLDHLCRNKKCINPMHLEPVPRSVNTLRMVHFWESWRQSERGQKYLAYLDDYMGHQDTAPERRP